MKDIFGVTAVGSDGPVEAEAHPVVPYVSEGERIVLVGLAPSRRIQWPDGGKTSPGSVADLALSQLGRLTVIVEVKIRGTLDGWQLQRHAGAWDMPVPAGRWEELPRGMVLVDWASVAAWFAVRAHERPLAQGLLEQLRGLGLTTGAAAPTDQERIFTAKRGVEPAVAPLDTILSRVRPADVRAAVDRLYGVHGAAHVSNLATDTKRDGRGVAARFEAAGEQVPPKAGRYGAGRAWRCHHPGEGIVDVRERQAAGPQEPHRAVVADVRDRLLFRGADRSLAVAMWAFADALTCPDQRRLRAHAGRLWTVAPPRSHATPELIEALEELGVSLT